MSARETTRLLAALLLACLLGVAAPAHAEAAGAVTVSADGGSLALEADGPWQGLRLTLGDPDGGVQVLESAGARLAVDGVDDNGVPRPDGVYVWELRGLTPADAVHQPGRRASDQREVHVASGHFTIADGAFVPPDAEEAPSRGSAAATAMTQASSLGLVTAEQVYNDDVSILGSLCVGFDCTSNEAFFADTIRLKENNLRIRFFDTSSSGAFPTNDWLLEANDSANGGANRFSVVDVSNAKVPLTVMANARDDALVLDGAKAGFGTAIPVLELHVLDGDTPGLRLEQDQSSGFAAQTWDVGGNEVNFFIRDATHGARTPFRIIPDALSDSLVIAAGGDVGIGTANPAARLEVVGDLLVSETNGRPGGNILLSGTVDGRDVSADGALLDSQVTLLDSHVADFTNPHGVTADQANADPAGTAALAVDSHEAAFDHADIPSALPVPVAEGGTGATDAATARDNLGIVGSRAGVVPVASFAGNPATATVTFASPYPTGTEYAVVATAMTNDVKKVVVVNLSAKDETGFTLTLGDKADDLVEVGWLARPTGE